MKTICMAIFLFSPERCLPGKPALCHVGCHWSTHGSKFIFIKNKMPPQNGVSVSVKAKWSCLVLQGKGFEISTALTSPRCPQISCISSQELSKLCCVENFDGFYNVFHREHMGEEEKMNSFLICI